MDIAQDQGRGEMLGQKSSGRGTRKQRRSKQQVARAGERRNQPEDIAAAASIGFLPQRRHKAVDNSPLSQVADTCWR